MLRLMCEGAVTMRHRLGALPCRGAITSESSFRDSFDSSRVDSLESSHDLFEGLLLGWIKLENIN